MDESHNVTLCKVCGSPAFRGGELCLRHTAIAKWSINTSIDNLGAFSFFQKCLAKAFKDFRDGIPSFHREIVWEVLKDKAGWKLYDRQIVIAAFRGSSKTTLVSKALALYLALTAKKRYIVISSKSSRIAEKSLRWIKLMLGNSLICAIFGDLRPDPVVKKLIKDDIPGVWQKSFIILKNGVCIESVGMGQQLRSSAEGEEVSRIDMFIADDTETDENTKTPERREGNMVWFFETVWPSIDIDCGTVVFINTETNTESILSTLLKPESRWRKINYKVSYLSSEGIEVPRWPKKFSMETIENIRANYEISGRLSSFYKEYYNEIRSEKGFPDHWIKYYSGHIFEQYGFNWIRYKLPGNPEEYTENVSITLGVDLAYTKGKKSNFTVLLPVALTSSNKKFILPFKRGQYTLIDDISPVGKVRTYGTLSEIIRMNQEHKFDMVVLDASGGGQLGVFQFLRKELKQHNIKVKPFRSDEEKIGRVIGTLQPHYELGQVYHQSGMTLLRQELVSLGDTTDDIVDAESMAFDCMKVPIYLPYNSTWSPSETMDSYKPSLQYNTNWMVT